MVKKFLNFLRRASVANTSLNVEQVAKWLDVVRGEALAHSRRLPFARRLYANRAWRLGFLFLIALATYLPLSLFFPLIVLVIGPLLWGMPHLIASMRFVPQMVQNRTSTHAIQGKFFVSAAALSFTGVTAWRIYTDVLQPNHGWQVASGSFLIEISIAFLTALAALCLKPRPAWWRIALTSMLVGGLAYLNFLIPLKLAGALVLIHNVVAFFYWMAAAKNKHEKLVSIGATLLFVGVSVAILFGMFDFVYRWMAPAFRFEYFHLHYSSYGKMIVADPLAKRDIIFHCVVAYAFGQALHYFVWLKAIPDQLRGVQTPACFQQSWRYLKRDLGSLGASIGITVCVVGWVAFPLMSFDLWRGVYFACASFHGFFEIAGLGMVGWRHVMSST